MARERGRQTAGGTSCVIDAQHEGAEPLILGIAKAADGQALELAELIGAVLVVDLELARILLEDDLERRIAPGCFGGAAGVIGIKVLMFCEIVMNEPV
nr:hypothetical protein [Aeromonas salmonicida]